MKLPDEMKNEIGRVVSHYISEMIDGNLENASLTIWINLDNIEISSRNGTPIYLGYLPELMEKTR